MLFKQIVALDNLNITKEAMDKIGELSENPIKVFDSDPKDQDEVKKRISDADCVLLSWRTKIDKDTLSACENLKFICLCATSPNNIDLEECKKRKIVISNIVDYGDEGVGEWIFFQLLSLARGLGKYRWKDQHVELSGKTLGIIGLGTVAKLVADIALGFHMKVLYFSKSRKSEWEKKGLVFVDKKGLLEKSDIITLQTPKDVKILDKEDFELMKGKILVNNTLGKPFNEEDFENWIKGENNFAVMDGCVSADFQKRFKDLDRVIISDYVAGRTEESIIRLGEKILENLDSYLAGKPINRVV